MKHQKTGVAGMGGFVNFWFSRMDRSGRVEAFAAQLSVFLLHS